jgi:hypothetical protein
MKASITIHVETLWTNRAELRVEAELDNPHTETNRQVISMMFAACRLLAGEARGENERSLFSRNAVEARDREVDERDRQVTVPVARVREHDQRADRRNKVVDLPAREQVEQSI